MRIIKTGLNKHKTATAVLLLMTAVAGWFVSNAAAGSMDIPLRHSDQGKDLRICSECHDSNDGKIPFNRIDHTKSFIENHGNPASQNDKVCAMCHSQSFCTDCHGAGVELKPSLKNHGESQRTMPHRGDYLTRHRIDGRIDPIKCFTCHGSPKSQRSCSQCHT
jgi:hypothetical protein